PRRDAALRTSKPGTIRLELQRTGMTDSERAGVSRPARTNLSESRFHLLDEQRDQVVRAVVPERPQGPQESLARECRLGPERHRPRHIESRADAAVEQDGHVFPGRAAYGRKRINGGGQPFHLSPAVV